MIYSQDQQRQHIREIQEYLYSISFYDNDIIRVIPDGIYGRETSLSVRSFQTEYGLPVTGEVDKQTWEKIVEIYREYVALPPYPIDVFPSPTFVLNNEHSGSLVYILQAMLRDICMTYSNIPNIKITGIYDENTINTVKAIQQIANISSTGFTNRLTWNIIVMMYAHLNNDFKF